MDNDPTIAEINAASLPQPREQDEEDPHFETSRKEKERAQTPFDEPEQETVETLKRLKELDAIVQQIKASEEEKKENTGDDSESMKVIPPDLESIDEHKDQDSLKLTSFVPIDEPSVAPEPIQQDPDVETTTPATPDQKTREWVEPTDAAAAKPKGAPYVSSFDDTEKDSLLDDMDDEDLVTEADPEAMTGVGCNVCCNQEDETEKDNLDTCSAIAMSAAMEAASAISNPLEPTLPTTATRDIPTSPPPEDDSLVTNRESTVRTLEEPTVTAVTETMVDSAQEEESAAMLAACTDLNPLSILVGGDDDDDDMLTEPAAPSIPTSINAVLKPRRSPVSPVGQPRTIYSSYDPNNIDPLPSDEEQSLQISTAKPHVQVLATTAEDGYEGDDSARPGSNPPPNANADGEDIENGHAATGAAVAATATALALANSPSGPEVVVEEGEKVPSDEDSYRLGEEKPVSGSRGVNFAAEDGLASGAVARSSVASGDEDWQQEDKPLDTSHDETVVENSFMSEDSHQVDEEAPPANHPGGDRGRSEKVLDLQEMRKKRKRSNLLSCALLCTIFLLVAIVIFLVAGFAAGLFNRNNDNNNNTPQGSNAGTGSGTGGAAMDTPAPTMAASDIPTEAPSASPTKAPTPAPTPGPTAAPSVTTPSPSLSSETAMASFVTSLSFADPAVFADAASPEARALAWLQGGDPLSLDARGATQATNDRIVQRYALTTVRFNTDTPWNDETNWLSADECTWFGVTCSNGVVTSLSLAGNGLTGAIPSDIALLTSLDVLDLNSNSIQGALPVSIGTMQNLRQLILFRNNIGGGIARLDFSGLNTLEVFDVDSNSIRGTLPDSLYSVATLQFLVLDNNFFRGTIAGSIGALRNLRRFTFPGNAFTGILPTQLGGLQGLRVLWASGNQLTGAVPSEVGNLGALESLDLVGNNLSGAIPSEIGGLGSLQFLFMSRNALSGAIPSELGSATGLRGLLLESNALTGVLPAELVALTDLGFLRAGSNDFAPSTIPSFVYGLTNLTELRLEAANLTGPIEEGIGNLVGLTSLRLHENSLSGSLPVGIGNLGLLLELHVQVNVLSGSVPSEIGQLGALTDLRLETNFFNETLPSEIGQLSSLVRLEIEHNLLSGQLPATITNLANLEILYCFDNFLSGALPNNIGQLQQLLELECQMNRFDNVGRGGLNGNLPRSLGDLVNLEILTLYQNSFNGAIPAELGNLANLVSLDLELNNLNGRIPRQLENIANLTTLRLGGNNLRDPIPAGLCVLPLQTFMVDCALTSCTCCSGCGSRALVSA